MITVLVAFRWVGRLFKKESRFLARYERSHPHFIWYVLVDAIVSVLLVFGGFQLYSHIHSTSAYEERLERTGGVALTASKFVDQAKIAGTPVYWLGPVSGSTYSLNRASKNVVVVTYLPSGSSISNASQARLTVETYTNSTTLERGDRIVASTSARKVVTSKGFIVEYNVNHLTSMTVFPVGVQEVAVVEYPSKQSEAKLLQDAGLLTLVK